MRQCDCPKHVYVSENTHRTLKLLAAINEQSMHDTLEALLKATPAFRQAERTRIAFSRQ